MRKYLLQIYESTIAVYKPDPKLHLPIIWESFSENGTIRDKRGFEAFFLNKSQGDLKAAQQFINETGLLFDLPSLACVISGMAECRRTQAKCLISFRTNEYLQIPKYLARYQVTHHHICKTIQKLDDFGWINRIQGSWNEETHTGVRTAVTPSRQFLDWLLSHPDDNTESYIEPDRVELRDRHGDKIRYVVTAQIYSYIRNIRRINTNNNKYLWTYTSIPLPESSPSAPLPLYPPLRSIDKIAEYSNNNSKILSPRFYRVFNETWVEGGRFYGDIQSLLRAERRTLLVDGEPTVELDYQAMHARMIYHKSKLDYSGDLYNVGLPTELRKIVKAVFLVIFNTANRTKAVQAAHAAIRKKGIKLPSDIKMAQVLIAIEQTHRPLRNKFYSKIGRKLQFLDSKVAEQVLLTFAKLQKPCLSVHDSFIVKASDEQLLRETMINSYKKILKTEFSPVISKENS